ncbi:MULTISPECIES: MarR family winged helix-turn-helix transcriptional regulator [Streptacidiphilus]|uniref:MarR family winged helix-turn-helix transcriptional regulator n=1 Tax=Streptacidiphilus cavernicola TaxID=3342716 RepID=A0ABV6UR97_9ACTN|nr:MarR family transcriptional regulator [Streptacidiphilus jeojiense]
MPDFLDLHGSTNKVVRALAEAGMRRHGLHLGQNLLLAELWRQDGRTPGEIAAAVNVTTPTVVKMATRMTAAGLLTRRRDERDNRLVRLWLTDAGRALQGPVEAERRSLEQQLTADLSGAEREQLMQALAKVHRTATDLLGGPVEPTGH